MAPKWLESHTELETKLEPEDHQRGGGAIENNTHSHFVNNLYRLYTWRKDKTNKTDPTWNET